MRWIKLTRVGFRAHAKLASRIVLFRISSETSSDSDSCVAVSDVQVRGLAERRRVLVRKRLRQVRRVVVVHRQVSRRAPADVRRTRCQQRHARIPATYDRPQCDTIRLVLGTGTRVPGYHSMPVLFFSQS